MSKRLHLYFIIPLTTIFIFLGPVYAQSENSAITAAEIISHIRYLASDELGGRESGAEGGDEAAGYIAYHFKSSGLKPSGGDGTYFQNFTFVSGTKLGESNSFTIKTGKKDRELELKTDFLPLSSSKNGTVQGELVFAGYGISAPELGYDDYAGIDVKDKIVLALRYTPEGYDPESSFYRYAPLHYKTMNAGEKGAKGIIFTTPVSQEEEEDLGGIRPVSSLTDSGIRVAILSREIAGEILSLAHRDMRNLERRMSDRKTASFVIPNVKVRIHTDLVQEKRSASNVAGLLECSDPASKDEVIVVGAHYDHIGLGGRFSVGNRNDNDGKIHNGADDNASGTAGLLELAEYFAGNRDMLKRSVLFIAFAGEELGLLGSSHYIKNPEIPLSKTAAMLNMDMIGRLRDNELTVMGTGTSPEWKKLIESSNSGVGLSIKTAESGFAASDQTVFLTKDIPVLLFFTGIHPDYHAPSDDWEKINSAGEEKIVKLIAGIIEKLSRTPEEIAFSEPRDGDKEQGMGAVSFNVYPGTVPDYSEQVDGVKLMGVRNGSPAEKAGLKEKDIIVKLAGKNISGIYDYVYALGGIKAEVPAEMAVMRDGKLIKLSVVPESRRRGE